MSNRTTMRINTAVTAGMLLALMGLMGCGGASLDARATAEQQSAYGAGKEAMKNHDYGSAERNLSIAITESRLSADLQEEAYLQRASARMELKKLDDAKADLDWLAERAANLDAVWVARGQLLRIQGDEAGASKAFGEARKINPNVVLPAATK